MRFGLTGSMSIEILYVDRHTVCRSTVIPDCLSFRFCLHARDRQSRKRRFAKLCIICITIKMIIVKNMTNLKSEMREFCIYITCRREYLVHHFGFPHESFAIPHSCCNICETSCLCDNSVASSLDNVFLHEIPEDQEKMYSKF